MQRIAIHPTHPQARLAATVAKLLDADAVAVLPTDASYVLACSPDSRSAVDRMRAIRQLDDRHLLTLICRDLSELANYAQVDNRQFRFLKERTPGAYVFILPATREVPRRLWHPSRKTLGLRVPGNPVLQALLEAFGRPLIATSLVLPGERAPLCDPDEIVQRLGKQVDVFVESDSPCIEPTTVIDLTGGDVVVVRAGKGPVDRPG
ncbi:MAG: L-threonylcarbamoyladenylate synthase [Lautropia sp.]